MKQTVIVVAALAVLAVSGGLYLQAGGGKPVAEAGDESAKAQIRESGGSPVGEVKLTEDGGEVLVRVNAHGLAAGFHGFHIHAVGICVAPFTSAGPHFNLPGGSHPTHSGDMPVLLINEDGIGEARFKTDRFGVDNLFDADGSAIIIHALPDNYANIPIRYAPLGPDDATLATGDAGGRVACGVVRGGH